MKIWHTWGDGDTTDQSRRIEGRARSLPLLVDTHTVNALIGFRIPVSPFRPH